MPSDRHLDDRRQHDLVFRGFAERNADLGATESFRAGHCPTVTM